MNQIHQMVGKYMGVFPKKMRHFGFYAPAIKWRKGIYIEFTLSMCVCVCLCIRESCPGHNLAVNNGI